MKHQRAATKVQEQWSGPSDRKEEVTRQSFPKLLNFRKLAVTVRMKTKLSFKKEVRVYEGKTKISISDTEFEAFADF